MKKLIVFLLLVLYGLIAKSQEIYFSQYFVDKLAINPSYASIGSDNELSVIFKDLFPAIEGGSKAIMASYNQKLAQNNGLALRSFYNYFGQKTFSTFDVELFYAQQIKISQKIKTSLSIGTIFNQKRLNANNLVFYSNIDPISGSVFNGGDYPNQKINKFSFSSGILIFSKQFLFGISTYYLSSKPCFVANGNYKFELKNNQTIIPTLVYRRYYNQNTLILGAYHKLSKLLYGLSFRKDFLENYKNNLIILNFGFIFDNFDLGFAYDFYLDRVQKQSFGAIECSFRIKLKKNIGQNTINCPAF